MGWKIVERRKCFRVSVDKRVRRVSWGSGEHRQLGQCTSRGTGKWGFLPAERERERERLHTPTNNNPLHHFLQSSVDLRDLQFRNNARFGILCKHREACAGSQLRNLLACVVHTRDGPVLFIENDSTWLWLWLGAHRFANDPRKPAEKVRRKSSG